MKVLRRAGRATFLVQTETPPYKYVSIEGPVAITSEVDKRRDLDELAYRYLGREVGEAYKFLLELRMDRGPLPPEVAEAELAAWWAARTS